MVSETDSLPIEMVYQDILISTLYISYLLKSMKILFSKLCIRSMLMYEYEYESIFYSNMANIYTKGKGVFEIAGTYFPAFN